MNLPLFNEVHIKDGRDGGLGNCRLGEGDGDVWNSLHELSMVAQIEAYVIESDYRQYQLQDFRSDVNKLRSHASKHDLIHV